MIVEFSAILRGITIRCHADFSHNDPLSKCKIGPFDILTLQRGATAAKNTQKSKCTIISFV